MPDNSKEFQKILGNSRELQRTLRYSRELQASPGIFQELQGTPGNSRGFQGIIITYDKCQVGQVFHKRTQQIQCLSIPITRQLVEPGILKFL